MTVLPSSTSAAGIARAAYRREIQEEIGHYRLVLATSNAYEPRVLTIARLRGDEIPRSRFDGHYAYSPSLDEARRVLTGSFDGATGTLALDEPFSSSLTSADLEITNTLPGTYYLDIKGANQIVNDALKRLLVWARIGFEGNGTRQHALGDHAWLTHEGLIDHIEDRFWGVPAGDPTEWAYAGWRVQQDGADLSLVTDRTYAADEPFTVVAIRPGDAWIRSGGNWADGSGLQSEADRAAAPLHWVRAFGCWQAYRYLLEVTEEDESLSDSRRALRLARYERERLRWAGVAARIKLREFPTPSAALGSSFVGVGTDPGYI